MKMEKILVSACLVGKRVRYNGIVKSFESHVLKAWNRRGWVVAICPEVAGGLPVPRSRSEISGGDGIQVLNGHKKVININGQDVTKYFLRVLVSPLLKPDKCVPPSIVLILFT